MDISLPGWIIDSLLKIANEEGRYIGDVATDEITAALIEYWQKEGTEWIENVINL